MGSSLVKVCGQTGVKKSKSIRNGNEYKNGEEQIEYTDEGGMVENNRDNYFTKDDFEKIAKKYPDYEEWMKQSMSLSTKIRSRQRIKWSEGELIGHGSFGRVVMGLNLQTGSIMAVKQVQIGISNAQSQQDRIKALQIEIDLLRQLSHKNIVRYYGSHKTKTTFNIFLEFISGGTIASLIQKFGPLSEHLARMYTRQILEGLEYLHIRNTIHRDIKGANVLVDNNGVCKLADFGTAKRISAIADGGLQHMPSIKGTANWMAPEIIKQTELGRSSDIWSVGCTVLEMLTGKAPWSHLTKAGSTQLSTLYQIASAKTHPPLPEGLSPEAVDFLKQCFKILPAERPNVIKLLNHKFITGNSTETPVQKVPSFDIEKLKAALNSPSPFSAKVNSEKGDTPIKDKEKFTFKQKPSALRSQEQSLNRTEALEETKQSENLIPIKKEGRKKKELKKILALNVTNTDKDEKQNEASNRPRFTLRSPVQTQNNSFNSEITNPLEKISKDTRTVSNPEPQIYRYEKSRLEQSNHYLKTIDQLPPKKTLYKKFRTDPIPSIIDQTETVEISITAKNTDRKPQNVPLSQRRAKHRVLRKSLYGSRGDEDFSSMNGSIFYGSDYIFSPDINSQHSRTKSFFGPRDMKILSDKDLGLTADKKIEEQAVAENDGDKEDEKGIRRYKEENHHQEQNNCKIQVKSPVNSQKESKSSQSVDSDDSDNEPSLNHQNHNKLSDVSIKTVDMPNGKLKGSGSSGHHKTVFDLGFSPQKDFSNIIGDAETTDEKRDINNMLGEDTPFRGIVLTESLVMSSNQMKDSTENGEQILQVPFEENQKADMKTYKKRALSLKGARKRGINRRGRAEMSSQIDQASLEKTEEIEKTEIVILNNRRSQNIESLVPTESIQLQKQISGRKKVAEESFKKLKQIRNNIFWNEKETY